MQKKIRSFLESAWAIVLMAACVGSVRAGVEQDILFSYAPSFATSLGGDANTRVNLANVATGVNNIYDQCGAGTHWHIAGFYQSVNNPVNWTTTGGMVGWLSGNNGNVADVVSYGGTVGADLVLYVVENSDSGSIGGVTQQPGMYASINPGNVWSAVVAHEIGGHAYGCNHQDGRMSPKTIMMHNYCGGGSAPPYYFSNPNMWWNGVNMIGNGQNSCLGGSAINGDDNTYKLSSAAQGVTDRRSRVAYGPVLNNMVFHWLFTNAPASAPAGTTNYDLVLGAPAIVRGNGATYTGNALRIPGGGNGNVAMSSMSAYIDLPNGIISSQTNMTIEIWATPLSAPNYARIMDFGQCAQAGDGLGATGEYTGDPNDPAPGTTSQGDGIMLTADIGTDITQQRLEAKHNGLTSTFNSSLATTAGVQHHYAITFTDGAGIYNSNGGRWQWYRDGYSVGFIDVSNHLADIQDVNNWLGRSEYSGDSLANNDYTEVRISNLAMNQWQVLANYLVGPNFNSSTNITLTGSDASGNSSFNAAGNWGSGSAPSAGNSYFTLGCYLRTPATGSSYAFAGDGLTVNSGASLLWKGTSSSTITINKLCLSDGLLQNAGAGTFTIAGNLTVTNTGTIRAGNGPVNIAANLYGNGSISYVGNTVTLSGNNSGFMGKTLVGTGISGGVSINSEAQLGPNPSNLTTDQLSFNRGWLYTTATMSISNANRGIQIGMNGAVFDVAAGTTLTLSSPLTSATFNSGVVGGQIWKQDSGTLVLNNSSSTYVGAFNVDSGSTSANDGAVRIANNAVMASARSPININNNNSASSTLQLDGTSGNITLPQWISLAGRNGTVPAIQNIAGTNSINGITINGGGVNYIVQSDAGLLTFYGGAIQSGVSGSRTLTFQGNGDSAIASTVQDGSATPLNFIKTGAGKLTMSGAMTYSGTTTVIGGKLLVNSLISTGAVMVASSGTLGGNGIIAGTVTVLSGGTLSPGGSIGMLTASNVVLNAGSTTFMEISKSSLTNDQLKVNGTITYGGALMVSNLGGTFALGDSFQLFNAAGIIGTFSSSTLPSLNAGLTWSFNPINGVLSVIAAGDTPPTISSVGNQTVNENASTGPLAFTVNDAETSAGSLTVSAASSNPKLLPPGSISFGGSGTNRTVTISPGTNQFGSATITLAVSDGSLLTTTSFGLTVNHVNQPPYISAIANQIGGKNTVIGPLGFTIGDPETAASSLTLSASSANTELVPTNNIVLGGSGANPNIAITPAANEAGVSTITITVSDGSLTASTTFNVTINGITTISKANNTTNLNLGASWVGGVTPDASAVAVWDSTVTSANTVALGGNLSWSGMMITNPAGPVAITAGNTLTLGTAGIDMSMASQNLTVSSGLMLGVGDQSWNVANGQVLTLNTGTFTRNTGSTLNIPGGGTVAASMTGLTNDSSENGGILGSWATIGTGANTAYATRIGGNISAYTSLAGSSGGTIASSVTSATDWTLTGTVFTGNYGANRTLNTILDTFSANNTLNLGNNNSIQLTLNGLLNSGAGTLTVQKSGNNPGSSGLTIGANRELVLNAANGAIVVSAPIIDNSGGASSLTVVGTGAVTLSGANTFSGNTSVNGTLQIGAATAIPSGSGKGNVTIMGVMDLNGFSPAINGLFGVGNLDNTSTTTTSLTVGSNNVTSTFSGVIKNSGGAVSLVKTGTGALTLAGNNTFSGGVTVQNAAGTLNVSSPAALGTGTLNMNIAGATLNNTSGGPLVMVNPLTVSANFTFAGSGDLTLGGSVNLGSLAKTITTTAGTLTLGGAVSGSGAFTKNGAGTLAFSGVNPFTGTTTVSAGTLLINGSASTGTIIVGSSGTLGGGGLIGGAVTVQSSGTLKPGGNLNTLTVNNSVTLQAGSTTVMKISQASQANDQLNVTGTLTYGGTLLVTNLDGTFVAGDSFQLFSAGSTTDTFAAMTLPTLDAGLAWYFYPPTGVLSVITSIPTDPISVSYSTSGNSLTLSWPADHTGWRLQTQTNALGTNWFDVPNSTTTNLMVLPMTSESPISVFFRMVYP